MYTDARREKYKHKELTGKIISCAFEVQNNLGCGFLEKVYQKALLSELKRRDIKTESHKSINIFYKNEKIGTYVPDLVVEDKVIIELKAVEFLTKIHSAQVLNYLKATGYEVGLILNFAKPRLEYKRITI